MEPAHPEVEEERKPLPPGSTLGGGMYTIERLIGEGGFALTYLATQGRWGYRVCIKEFFPIGCQRQGDSIVIPSRFEARFSGGLQAFHQETEALTRFNHPGIVRVLDTFSGNGTAYMVQEFLEGMTLADGLTRAGKMKQEPVLKVAQQLGQALLMVHGAGLVHSDLKPENIFLTRDGRYVLLDFGLTRGFLSARNSSGSRGLSPGYAPPEQYLADTKLTPVTDVYALAATIYTLLTGDAPPDAQLRCQGHGLPNLSDLNASVTPKIEQAILNGLELDQRYRPPGVREFFHQLGIDTTPKAIAYRPPVLAPKLQVKAHHMGVSALALHSFNRQLYSGGSDGTLKVWSWPDMQLLHTVHACERGVSALAVSRKGKYVVSASERGEIKLWTAGLDSEPIVLLEPTAPVTSLTFDKKTDLIAAAFTTGQCRLISALLPEPVVWDAHRGVVSSIDFHPSEPYVVTSGADLKIRFWTQNEPSLFHELEGHTKAVQSAYYGPDGLDLLTASNDLSVKLWDLTSFLPVRDLKGHQALVFAAYHTSNPQYAISLSGDHCLRCYNLNNGRVAAQSEVHKELSRTFAVDPFRPLAVSGGTEGIAVWEFPDWT